MIFNYAILRFMPFSETQEFANVGVVISIPKLGYIDYKLAPTRFARITHFFDDIDGLLYKNALNRYEGELKRVSDYVSTMHGAEQVHYFNELTRMRESVIHFGEVRTAKCNNPKEALESIYNRFVGRNFVTKEYREAKMISVLKQQLNKTLPLQYKEKEVKAGIINVKLPLVASIQEDIRAIKPIAFHHNKALSLLEHGEVWIKRVERIVKAGTMDANKMLFAVEEPDSKTGKLYNAFTEVKEEMLNLGTIVHAFSDKQKIMQFAAGDLSPENYSINSY